MEGGVEAGVCCFWRRGKLWLNQSPGVVLRSASEDWPKPLTEHPILELEVWFCLVPAVPSLPLHHQLVKCGPGWTPAADGTQVWRHLLS